jgi:hypothetical protein
MPFELLHERLPDLAERETRTATVLLDNLDGQLPPAEYAFHEMFCNEPRCDCRRVFFSVTSSLTEETEAVIAYGWEGRAFYRKWLKHPSTKEEVDELQGPILNPMSPQSIHAPAILELFTDLLLPDVDYMARVIRHYRLFRATVDQPRNPLLRRRRPGG